MKRTQNIVNGAALGGLLGLALVLTGCGSASNAGSGSSGVSHSAPTGLPATTFTAVTAWSELDSSQANQMARVIEVAGICYTEVVDMYHNSSTISARPNCDVQYSH